MLPRQPTTSVRCQYKYLEGEVRGLHSPSTGSLALVNAKVRGVPLTLDGSQGPEHESDARGCRVTRARFVPTALLK